MLLHPIPSKLCVFLVHNGHFDRLHAVCTFHYPVHACVKGLSIRLCLSVSAMHLVAVCGNNMAIKGKKIKT